MSNSSFFCFNLINIVALKLHKTDNEDFIFHFINIADNNRYEISLNTCQINDLFVKEMLKKNNIFSIKVSTSQEILCLKNISFNSSFLNGDKNSILGTSGNINLIMEFPKLEFHTC